MRTEQNQGQDHATLPIVTSRAFPILSAAIATGVFILDTITPAEIVFSVLYVGVVLLSTRFLQGRGITGPAQDLCLIERLGRTDWELIRRDLKPDPQC